MIGVSGQEVACSPDAATAALVEELATGVHDEPDVKTIVLPCSICKEDVMCTSRDMSPMTNHLEQMHKQRTCPVCAQMFDASMPQIDKYFHMHVENHFDVPHYPRGAESFEDSTMSFL